MKKPFSIIILLFLWLGTFSFAQAQNDIDNAPRYGFAPEVFDSIHRVWQGVGENGYLAGAICLDPTSDPAVERLRGKQIVGVRCYLNHAYAQSRQKRSLIFHTVGEPSNTPTQKICDFAKGWNNVLFDTPVTIGDDPIYVGLQVYETIADDHPIGAYSPISVDGGCWFNLKKEGWRSYTDRGTLMIYAILADDAAPLLERSVFAQTANAPLVVEPAKDFAGEVSFHNCSANPVSKVVLSMRGQGDEEAAQQTVTFDTPLGAYEGRIVPLPVRTGSEVGTNQWLELSVTKVNGEDAQLVHPGVTWHYVTYDAFTRVPLIEEFTGQTCSNCPFMFYFLDIAMEQHTMSDLVYVAHHAGFQKDALTQPVDEALTFLFGEYGTYNPAVMFDRIVPVGQEVPVISAKVAEVEPYASALAQAAMRPAMASVNISAVKSDEGITPHVEGRINTEMAASGVPLYLSVYFIEDGLTTDEYPQFGMDDEGAPSDLKDRFRHNGVIRHNFCTNLTGDQLVLGENNTYSVDFATLPLANKNWKLQNCQVVAFVHMLNQTNMRQNQVLNANRLPIAEVLGISSESQPNLRPIVGSDGRIIVNSPNAEVSIYDLRGVRQATNSRLLPGTYIVKVADKQHGQQIVTKLLVK